jgi:hypothetical protein
VNIHEHLWTPIPRLGSRGRRFKSSQPDFVASKPGGVPVARGSMRPVVTWIGVIEAMPPGSPAPGLSCSHVGWRSLRLRSMLEPRMGRRCREPLTALLAGRRRLGAPSCRRDRTATVTTRRVGGVQLLQTIENDGEADVELVGVVVVLADDPSVHELDQ